MEQKIRATLRLDNGMEFKGFSFGFNAACSGEVSFSTAMVGYTESMTDPSSSGQILCITYPVIGNYGAPDNNRDEYGIMRFLESEKIQVRGLVVTDYSEEYSHWNAAKSLDTWMKENKVPGIYGVDTRELAKVIRDNGTMAGYIIPEGCESDVPAADPADRNLVSEVSCKEVIRYGSGDKKVVVVDCGMKNNILRYLLSKGVEVIRVPWNYDFSTLEYNGLFISGGPGNPELCGETVENVRKALDAGKPVFATCLGSMILALAAGASVVRLKSGHHGHNQPVRMDGTNRCFITSQNHSYAIDASTLPQGWSQTFLSLIHI